MGNNHDKYFGSDKRKIIILGLDNAGKTSKKEPIFSLFKVCEPGEGGLQYREDQKFEHRRCPDKGFERYLLRIFEGIFRISLEESDNECSGSSSTKELRASFT